MERKCKEKQTNKSLEEVKVLKKCLCFQTIDNIRTQDKNAESCMHFCPDWQEKEASLWCVGADRDYP